MQTSPAWFHSPEQAGHVIPGGCKLFKIRACIKSIAALRLRGGPVKHNTTIQNKW